MASTPDRIGRNATPVILVAATLGGFWGCGTVVLREQQFKNEAQAELRDHYSVELADEWAPRVDSLIFGDLTAAREDTVAVDIEAGEWVGALGSCDADCGDLNLAVYGPEWTPWAIDSELPGEGKYPFASGRAEDSGTYRVVVQMPNCRAQPCYYALWLLQRRAPPGGDARERPVDRPPASSRPEGWNPR